MNIKELLKRVVSLWPHLAIIVGFAVLSAIYFYPVMEGKDLPQMDNTHAIGAAQELKQYEQATGEQSQWTNSMFGGMPAYQIKGDASNNIFHGLSRWIRFGLPYTTMAIVFLYMLGFYMLMMSMKMNKWVAVAGAVAFAFGSYNLIIIVAGHITKAYAIALMPTVIAGVMLTYNATNLRQRIGGGVYTTVALGLELAYNHVQITYYLALAMIPLVVAKLIYAIRDKVQKEFWINSAVLVGAAALAILPGVTNLWTTYEYGKYSIRGASELTARTSEAQKETGLDREYAFSWSYGLHETPTLLIPNVVGGASEAIGYDNKAVAKMDGQIRDVVATQVTKYWGGRSFTSGPVYAGAVVCFLFFIGLFYYNGREKWWIIAATILSIMLAWGKNFAVFNDFMFYHFPLYNKFRTVEMALVIASVTIPLLGMLGLKEIWDNPERIRYEAGKFFGAIGLTAGIAVVIAVMPSVFYDFMSADEIAQFGEMVKENPIYDTLRQAIIEARIELTVSDAMRSAVFILLASSALWFFSTRHLNEKTAMATIIVLILIDMWQIDKRYLGEKNFEKKRTTSEFVMSAADKMILADKEPHRVMSLYVNPFNEVRTSYFHQSVGGYHGAKLRRYQDVIDRYLSTEYQMIAGALRNQDYENIEKTLRMSPALNMLNTKYLIYNPNQQPIVNPYAMGAAWYVEDVKIADSADEAIAAIGSTDLRTTAIIEGVATTTALGADSMSTVVRTKYAPDVLEYKTSSKESGVVVFSEIYYDKGWHAYIDGKETDIMHADYILRALNVPAGEHTIRFEFRPESYRQGNIISMVGSILILVLISGACFMMLRKKEKE